MDSRGYRQRGGRRGWLVGCVVSRGCSKQGVYIAGCEEGWLVGGVVSRGCSKQGV